LSAISTPPISEEKGWLSERMRIISYCALAIVFAAVYVGSMFSPALLDDADSTHAEAAREMFVTGDYVTLHVNGVRYALLPNRAVVAEVSGKYVYSNQP
jgi:hypothetical protein